MSAAMFAKMKELEARVKALEDLVRPLEELIRQAKDHAPIASPKMLKLPEKPKAA